MSDQTGEDSGTKSCELQLDTTDLGVRTTLGLARSRHLGYVTRKETESTGNCALIRDVYVLDIIYSNPGRCMGWIRMNNQGRQTVPVTYQKASSKHSMDNKQDAFLPLE